jgi:hypothetical protein
MIYNAYNRHTTCYQCSTPPSTIFTTSSLHTLIVGDFNIHHPSTEPTRTFSGAEFTLMEPYFKKASNTNYILLYNLGSSP